MTEVYLPDNLSFLKILLNSFLFLFILFLSIFVFFSRFVITFVIE